MKVITKTTSMTFARNRIKWSPHLNLYFRNGSLFTRWAHPFYGSQGFLSLLLLGLHITNCGQWGHLTANRTLHLGFSRRHCLYFEIVEGRSVRMLWVVQKNSHTTQAETVATRKHTPLQNIQRNSTYLKP